MLDRNDLLVRRLLEEDVDIPDVGTVRVRGLSRGEVFDLRGDDISLAELEIRTLAACLIEPVISVDDAREWYYGAPQNETGLVLERIRKLSALDEGAQKSNGTTAHVG